MATFRKHGDRFQAIVKRRGSPLTSHTFDRRAETKIWATQIEAEMDGGQYLPRVDTEGILFATWSTATAATYR